MIEPLVAAVKEHVLGPQAAPDVPPDRRVYVDHDAAPLNVTLQTAEVVPVDSTPINVEIGHNLPSITVRHRITVAVACESDTLAHAARTRDAIVTDLLRRAVRLDWTDLDDLPPEIEVTRVGWLLEYPDLDPGSIAAWATLTITLDTEWSL